MIRWLLTLSLGLVLIACASRSVWREISRERQVQLRTGERVRITLKGGEIIKGKVVETTPEAVTIRATVRKGEKREKQVIIHTYPWGEIGALESEVISGSQRRQDVRNGIVAIGGVIGLGFLLLSLAAN